MSNGNLKPMFVLNVILKKKLTFLETVKLQLMEKKVYAEFVLLRTIKHGVRLIEKRLIRKTEIIVRQTRKKVMLIIGITIN